MSFHMKSRLEPTTYSEQDSEAEVSSQYETDDGRTKHLFQKSIPYFFYINRLVIFLRFLLFLESTQLDGRWT